MRDNGIPNKLLAWRWAPTAALALGSLSFVGFAMLAIPERIGSVVSDGSSPSRLGGQFASTQSPAPGNQGSTAWSAGRGAAASMVTSPSPLTNVITRNGDAFPRRGFSPPLDRPDPPAAPPPQPVAEQPAPPPQPQPQQQQAAPETAPPPADAAPPQPVPAPPPPPTSE